MGNWNINIQGIGCHHNAVSKTDADVMAAKFLRELLDAGHHIEAASFTFGAKEDIADKTRELFTPRPNGGIHGEPA